jgi:hypothetical protein
MFRVLSETYYNLSWDQLRNKLTDKILVSYIAILLLIKGNSADTLKLCAMGYGTISVSHNIAI